MNRIDETDRADDDNPSGAGLEPGLEPRPRRRKAERGLGSMIGGVLVGFDYQVFRATKPPAELVEAAKPVRGLSGEGGERIDLDVPEAAPAPGDGRSPAPGRPRRPLPAV